MAEADDDVGCWKKKAAYDQCFDQWYTNVFLQHKAQGHVGCQQEYKAYSECYMRELDKEKQLVTTIKSVMAPDVRARYEASEAARDSNTPQEQANPQKQAKKK